MKIVLKVGDVVELARRFRTEPVAAMQEVVTQVRATVVQTLERVMDAEIDLVLGEGNDPTNKRNGHTSRTYAIKGVGEVTVKVPRDRKGAFKSAVVPPSKRYDEAIEKDIAMLHLAGISTRTLALVSRRVLGLHVSAQEVSNSMQGPSSRPRRSSWSARWATAAGSSSTSTAPTSPSAAAPSPRSPRSSSWTSTTRAARASWR